MNELALFAGTGGGILGSILLGHRIVGAVEIDPYCREVLLRRQEEKVLPPFPIWDDARTFDGKPWRGKVDLVSAGFPCQPFSVAGCRRGEVDGRNMWPDTICIIREVGPRFAFLENVPGLIRTAYFGTILGELAEAGFDAKWEIVSAGEIGAPHKRERLWILAHSNSNGGGIQHESFSECKDSSKSSDNGTQEFMAKPKCHGLERRAESKTSEKTLAQIGNRGWWGVEPDVGRVADGVAFRVDRLKALGNGQVPRVVVEAWERLMKDD